uniref:Uncharacterized protein n=1 Tax=viral metagenome TaxID=1070528 RepID=A0A6C0EP24_9ZZZZ
MNIFKSFSIKETIEEIEKYIKDFEEFEPFINVSYEHYINQIIVNYNFTLRRIKNKISWQNFIKRYLLNQKLNNYYIGKMNIIKTNKMLYYFNYWI